jgi:hypothetical protein
MSDPRVFIWPDKWAQSLRLRVDGRPFDLEGREYIQPVIRDTSQKVCIRKAAQTAFTIAMLVRTFHWITEKRFHHLYLLPLKTGAVPFVQKRIDPIIDSNDYLRNKFKSVDNRTHKQTYDDIALLIRGTNVESELQETPADAVVFDEYDRMVQEFLEDAKHRTDGSSWKRLTYLSTPSAPGHGIDSDEMWGASDQCHWEIPCPHCGRFQFISFEENVKIGNTRYDCTVECSFCSKEINDEVRHSLNKQGRWTAWNLNGNFRGYHVNQFASPTMHLADIMESYFDGQKDQKKLKSFFTQSLGLPYASPGDKITVELLDACREKGYKGGGIPNGPVYIGVDVGHDTLYMKADFIDRFNRRVFWQIRKFIDRPGHNAFRQLEDFLNTLTSFVCVIDAHPDKREAAELSRRYSGKVFLGFETDRPQTEQMAVFNKVVYGQPTKIVIDRTMAFDAVIQQMINGEYVLPFDARELGDPMPRKDFNGFYSHMIQMARVEKEDAKGRIVAFWSKNKNADHFHHADMFALVATTRKAILTIPPSMHDAMKKAGSLVGT